MALGKTLSVKIRVNSRGLEVGEVSFHKKDYPCVMGVVSGNCFIIYH